MKRSEALKLIENQLDFLNGKFEGMRTEFTDDEIRKADVILTTLEDVGMVPPEVTVNIPYDSCEEEGYDTVLQNVWEEE